MSESSITETFSRRSLYRLKRGAEMMPTENNTSGIAYCEIHKMPVIEPESCTGSEANHLS